MRTEIESKQIRDYLFGTLPKSEASTLEREMFLDDETFERVLEIENLLVDSYVRGRFSPKDREKFERCYLASPVHRRRVRFAMQLIRWVDQSMNEPELQVPWRTKLSGRSVFGSVGRFALAATVCLAVAGNLWLFFSRMRLHDELTRLDARSEARPSGERQLADQLAAARGRSEELAAELERLRNDTRILAARPAGPIRKPSPHSKSFAFLLSPLLVRSGGPPQLLAIPADTEIVHLRMNAESNEERRFQVEVQAVEGRQIVWSQRAIKPEIDDSGNGIVTTRVPAGKLAPGDYILTLSAADSMGKPVEVDRYFFRVSRPQ